MGIVGKSGAGKSTLARCINLLERPSSGQVIFKSQDITALPASQLVEVRKSIGMIFQSFNLLMQKSALDNVAFPLRIAGVKKEERRAQAFKLLEQMGIADKANSYPAQLSGGQKQRVAIARALATNPSILLCDEATSALDAKTTVGILKLLKAINETTGVTLIVITHELAVVKKICNRCAVIEDGQIVEIGSTQEIFDNPQSAAAKNLILLEDEE